MKPTPQVLTVDIGGTNVKVLASGQAEPRKFSSGKDLTPRKMVGAVKKLAEDWEYDVVSIGYPGQVVGNRAFRSPTTRWQMDTAVRREFPIHERLGGH